MDCSLPGSSINGILKARVLEWGAIAFSLLLSHSIFVLYRAHLCMKCSFGISNFPEEISSLSHSVVFLYFFALIADEVFLISSSYSLEICIQMLISFLFSELRKLGLSPNSHCHTISSIAGHFVG